MQSLRVVLVRTKYARNVGMVARALANYGLQQLILIDPQCELDDEAKQGAAGAQGPLDKVTIYPHWQRFYDWEPEGVRIAFSARDGRRRSSFNFSNLLQNDNEFRSEIQDKTTYLIFGPEDHGLAESDLDFVHRIVHLDLPGEMRSMNISHAVVATLSLLHLQLGARQAGLESESIKDPFFFPEQTLKKWLEALNVDLETHPRVNAYSVLKKLMLKSFPTAKELKILENIVQQTVRKLRESKKDPELSSEDSEPRDLHES